MTWALESYGELLNTFHLTGQNIFLKEQVASNSEKLMQKIHSVPRTEQLLENS